MTRPRRHDLFRKALFAALRALPVGWMLVSSGCTAQPAREAGADGKPAPSAALFKTGKRLYERQCAACHGPAGKGDGAAAYLIYPKPRDFAQNEFRLVSTTSQQATDEDLYLTITRGMPGSAMPSWEALTAKERWALVYTVRFLAEGETPQPIDPASVIQVPQEPSKTAQGIERGRVLFAQACASCHGLLGKGDGDQTMHLDNLGYPIKPRDLTAGIFKGSSESRDLYKRIVAGLPGSPMPSYAGAYADEQIWDLVHYVQSLVPPGVEENVRMHQRTIPAHRVLGEIPSDPAAPAWTQVEPAAVALTPLWWRNQRIGGIQVKALHNGKDLAFHLSWDDSTRDDTTVAPQSFSDGVAVQVSLQKDPPFFGMGDQEDAVAIWHWKASWQEDLNGWRDVETAYPHAAVDWYPGQSDYKHGEPFEVRQAKTASQDPQFMGGWGAGNPLSTPHRTSAAEEATAKGMGTLTSRPPALQRIQAQGVWQEGRWQVVLKSGLKLKPGQAVRVAFAAWDGHAGDRNGQKSVSIWNELKLER